VERAFHAVSANDDVAAYALARDVLDSKMLWLEDGVFHTEDLVAGAAEAAALARSAS
jgi:hypothetical protein